MIRYIVKETSKGTPINPHFAGKTAIGFYGREDKEIEIRTFSKSTGDYELKDYMVKKYGYKRECDAKKNWTYNNPLNTQYWESNVEIIKVEVEEA